jgi:ABC-type transport system involved in Fe-S cluster assembly fused permease/ATPase subunit
LLHRLQPALTQPPRSALDAESEFVVQEAIDSMLAAGNMTVIVIAHRLSTIKNADTIAVVMGGKVVEQGAHEALLGAGGHYAQLVTRQLAQKEQKDQTPDDQGKGGKGGKGEG